MATKMKKILNDKEGIIKSLWDKKKIVVRTPTTVQDYDYYDLNEKDFIHNPIVGFTTVGHMRELRQRGVVIYDNCWRIPVQECLNYKGEKRFRPTDLFFEYKNNNFRLQTSL